MKETNQKDFKEELQYIGSAMRAMRKESCVTQMQVTKTLQTSQCRIGQIELGKGSWFNIRLLLNYCNLFGYELVIQKKQNGSDIDRY